jgi:hypothetical protein
MRHALDAAGRRRFWEIWNNASWFKAYEECRAFEHRA